MIAPQDPHNEKERLKELESYMIMETEIEEEFDNLTKLASEIVGTKISLVSLLDDKRQWFKSKVGMETSETPKELSFCGHAIERPNDILIIPDTREDKRFFDNPFVTSKPNIIFYAGVPLVSKNGFPLGTLCVLDDSPKELTEQQISALKTLSSQVMKLIELRKANHELKEKTTQLKRKNEETERFAYFAAHDLKTPLNNIKKIIDILIRKESIDGFSVNDLLNMVKESSERLTKLIDEILEFSKVDKLSVADKSKILPDELLAKLKTTIIPDTNCSIILDTEVKSITLNATGTLLVLQNLVTNAIKYCDKPETIIVIGLTEQDDVYEFYVKDNGPGIDPVYKDKIFKPFEVLASEDSFGNRGTGLGLSIVEKILEKMGGVISFDSEMGIGTTFTFTVKKSE
ncbi:sensor histidine kinase [Aquimarina brevivitae]|uniref:histidine kinase n=1 Tax=Aquimarina brevivitae TaxID=323412 RepID=A0A4Q7PJD9_9FLAO|nr:GAF domain-containing sensor histidine kinase [Aquimarina brevivitae]RZS99022.1 GAF sensor signal transduction histidine kinase [Aquimarina brevivitae]